MSTTIKGIRQELLYSGKSVLVSEMLMPFQTFSFKKLKEITYHYGDHGNYGYLRFHEKNGSVETFLFRKKRNEQVSEFLDTVQIGYPDVKLNEQYERIDCRSAYNYMPGRKKALCWISAFIILLGSFFFYMNNISSIMHDKKITLEAFNQCEIGMTYEQCEKIIGSAGTPLAESKIIDTNMTAYMWYANEYSGANAELYFVDGKLYQKAQIGLE